MRNARFWSSDKLTGSQTSCGTRTQLSVDDLELDDDECITGLKLEFGSVDVGLASTTPLTYMVKATSPLAIVNGAAEIIIPNSAESHITRNWHNGDGLKDDAVDKVETRVIPTMSFDGTTSTWVGDKGSWSSGNDPFGHGLVKTFDGFPWWLVLVVGGVVIVAGGGVLYARHRLRLANEQQGESDEASEQ